MQIPAYTDISGVLKCIDNELSRVKVLFESQFTSSCGKVGVGELLAYFEGYRGKMLRPALVLLSGSACGSVTDEHIQVAAIMEMIHNATLLHDDVIDEGEVRRGAPTINSLWGNESAVLLGDFLLSKAFRMCADLQHQIVKIIADASMRVCEGELRQVIGKRNWRLSEDEYIEIITEKSAALFSACCELGALLAGGGKTDVKSLASFGLNTGIAFQITDDLLDIIGDENKTGKTLGSDVDRSKPTLPLIHLLRTVEEEQRRELIKKFDAAEVGKEALLEMLETSGSFEYARSQAKEFVAKAVSSLIGFEETEAGNALTKTAEFIAVRAG